jgi:diguanylate cyclase
MAFRVRPNAPLIIGGALLAFSLTWLVVGLSVAWTTPVLGWVPLPVMALLAAHACRRVYRAPSLARPIRQFWARFGVGCALLAVAVTAHAVDALGGPVPSQRISPGSLAVYLCVCLLVLWAMLRLPAPLRSRSAWARFGLDAGIVLITTGELCWHFTLRRLDAWTEQSGSAVPVLAIITVAVIAIIAFVKVAFAGSGQLDRTALRIVASGFALAAAGGGLTPLLIGRPYLSSTFVAVPIGAFAVQIAATRQVRGGSESPAERAVSRRFSVVPYVAVAATAVLLLTSDTRGAEARIVAICAIAVTALVVIRQITALRDNGKLLDTVDANLRQLRRYQQQLAHQVSHDPLTETANRSKFEEKVTDRLALDGPFQVALIDLDDFKDVNDRLGHGTGDALLKAVSRRLHEAVRAGDTVARLGGDEFTLLLPDLAETDTAVLLQRLVEHMHRPLLLTGHEMVPRVSVGVTTSQAGDTPEELIRRADVAMYAAKSKGGGRWTWFDPMMDHLADVDARLGADLRHAIGRDELFVLYQPVVELPTGRLAGVEALVRWRHPEHGLVSPAIFIPLAERNGYIVELGQWILDQVIRQAAAWHQAFGADGPERVSVNISARQLHEPGFAASVAAMLGRAGLDPSRLTAEITETAVLGTGQALAAVRELHDLGLHVALDDFGTGQSSLSLLVCCPVDVLKVDKSFVDGVTSNSPQAVILDGLIGITDGLGIQAVAEGVETADQARRLHEIGYRYAQGFHFARPLTSEAIDVLLRSRRTVLAGP